MGESVESLRAVTAVALGPNSSVTPVSLTQAVLEAPLRILGPVTHSTFSTLLDSHKVLLSPHGLHRDWRGLAESARLDVPSLVACSRISYTSHCLHLWGRAGGTVGHLKDALLNMDRHDVLADTHHLIESDWQRVQREGFAALPMTLQQEQVAHAYADDAILTVHDMTSLERGGGLTHYDALLLHADEDIQFANIMLEKLENQYKLKLCVKDRDLVAGLQFESVSVAKLITERCSRVVVLLSKAFLQSPLNTYFTNFAGALSIDQRRRIVIPCMLEPCQKPSIISFCHTLDYFRAQGYWDYWKKLRDSIVHCSVRPAFQILELTDSNFNRLTTTEDQSNSRQLQLSSHQPNAILAVAAAAAATAPLREAKLTNNKKHKTRVRSTSSNFISKIIKKVNDKSRTGRSASESTCDETFIATQVRLDGDRVPLSPSAPFPSLEAGEAAPVALNGSFNTPSSSFPAQPHSVPCNSSPPLNSQTELQAGAIDVHNNTNLMQTLSPPEMTDVNSSCPAKAPSEGVVTRETCLTDATASSLHLLLPDIPDDEISPASSNPVAKFFKKRKGRVKVSV